MIEHNIIFINKTKFTINKLENADVNANAYLTDKTSMQEFSKQNFTR